MAVSGQMAMGSVCHRLINPCTAVELNEWERFSVKFILFFCFLLVSICTEYYDNFTKYDTSSETGPILLFMGRYACIRD